VVLLKTSSGETAVFPKALARGLWSLIFVVRISASSGQKSANTASPKFLQSEFEIFTLGLLFISRNIFCLFTFSGLVFNAIGSLSIVTFNFVTSNLFSLSFSVRQQLSFSHYFVLIITEQFFSSYGGDC